MRCPKCHSASAVVDSREVGGLVRRRRGCVACCHRWTTREVPDQCVPSPALAAGLLGLAQELEAVAEYVRECAEKVGAAPAPPKRKRRAVKERGKKLVRCDGCGALVWADQRAEHTCVR